MAFFKPLKKTSNGVHLSTAAIRELSLKCLTKIPFKINESRYVALFVVSGSIKKFLSLDYANTYLFLIFFSIDFDGWKSVGLLYITYIVIHNFKVYTLNFNIFTIVFQFHDLRLLL